MNPTTRRLIITLALLVFVATGLILLMKAQREPQKEPAPQQKQEVSQKQAPLQKQEPSQEHEVQQEPRKEQKPGQEQQIPQVPPQEQVPQEQVQQELPTPPPEEPRPRVDFDIRTLRTQIEDYKSRIGAYPTTAQGLGVLGVIAKDPWQRDYIYESPSSRNRESYDLFSAGPDGKPDTPDDDWGENGE